MVWHGMGWDGMEWHGTTWYSMVWYGMVLEHMEGDGGKQLKQLYGTEGRGSLRGISTAGAIRTWDGRREVEEEWEDH